MSDRLHLPGLEDWTKPNVRKIFLPDPGHIIFEADLAQADAQTVAWEAEDEPLMSLFKAARTDPSIDLHSENAKDIYGLMRKPTRHERQMAKHGVHGANFGATPYRLAKTLDMTRQQASQFLNRWFRLHPAIKKWHRRVEDQLMETRQIANKFGYRRIFFGRIDNILPEALAWVPQSTTVIIIDKGLNNLCRNLPEAIPLLQVHDSIVGQYLINHHNWIRQRIIQEMTIEVPYDEPMTIPVDLEWSEESWGSVKPLPDPRKFGKYQRMAMANNGPQRS